jgi:hypothetical protein
VLAWFKDQQVKKQVAEMLSGMGLDEYTVEGEAIGRFSLPFEQIDRMLVSLKARRNSVLQAGSTRAAPVPRSGHTHRTDRSIGCVDRERPGGVNLSGPSDR